MNPIARWMARQPDSTRLWGVVSEKQLSGLDASFLLLERPTRPARRRLDPSELSAPIDLGAADSASERTRTADTAAAPEAAHVSLSVLGTPVKVGIR